MKLQPCDCQDARYFRIPRQWWMRLISERRLYQCEHCRTTLFLPEGIGAIRARSSADTLPKPVPSHLLLQGTDAGKPAPPGTP
jgi:hypothetical protein